MSNSRFVVIDYCSPSTPLIAHTPWREWLRTYAQHARGAHYLKNFGEQDITVQVMIDQLSAVAEPDAARSQAQFLQLWGISDLVEEGKRVWNESASAPTVEAMRMRSRVSESEALLDPHGLGGFTVLEWSA
jgi:SAM-dependent MidA family methyltransferase